LLSFTSPDTDLKRLMGFRMDTLDATHPAAPLENWRSPSGLVGAASSNDPNAYNYIYYTYEK
jgi:hypothetical protein